jgi:hypothetical protein
VISTHSQRLENWLGQGPVAHLSRSMKDWYGPPIAVAGVPGNIRVCGDGDFIGTLREGYEVSWLDRARDLSRRLRRGARIATRPKRAVLHAGFASLSDLIAESTAGKRREYMYNKVGPTGVVNVTSSLWRVGPQPAVGAAPAAVPGGTAFDATSTGGFPFTNPTGGDTQHFVAGFSQCSIAPNNLLLYDLIFGCAPSTVGTATQAVTGVPTRYQNTTGGNADSIDGNFLAFHVGGTALAAVAHNWTVCTYTDQTGAASTLPSLTGVSGAIVDRLDHPNFQWFAPLETGDRGIKALTQLQESGATTTGVIWAMIGHPIAWFPIPLANVVCSVDGINTAFNLARIFDNACLALLEVNKPVTTAATYSGTFTTVAG